MSSASEDNKPPVRGPTQLQLERLVLGQLSAKEVRQLERQVGAERLEARRRAMEAENAEFFAEHPAERVLPRIEQRLAIARDARRAETRSRSLARHLIWAAPAAAAAVLLLAFWMGVFDGAEGRLARPLPGDEATRIKGLEPDLRIYRSRDVGSAGAGELERLDDGDAVRPGDVIQVGYVAAGREYGVIVSIDGAGAVTLHAPADPGRPAHLRGDGEVLLDYGFQLDDAPAFERFFLVTGETPISPRRVVESARQLASDPSTATERPLALPEGWEQTSFTLRKVPR